MRITRYIPAVLALALLAMSGTLHGMWTNRWFLSKDLETAVARLNQLPTTIGDWQSTEENKVDPRQLEMAEIVGYRSRVYTQKHTGKRVSIFLVCGRSGPISRHTPDICYQGLGYQLAKEPVKQTAKCADGEKPGFWTGKFEKPSAGDALRIHWSWCATGDWLASDNPRMEFGDRDALYKLYVSHVEQATPDGSSADETSLAFIEALIPELRKCLFPPSHPQSS